MNELIQKLIEIESISGNEATLVEFFANWLASHFKITPEVIDRNIVLTITGDSFNESSDTTLLLCSHIDTVPPCSGWTKDPFKAKTDGDKIFGLGANDALASVVSMTFAALDAASTIHRGRLVLCFACEEEAGNKGFVSVEPKLPRYTYGIFGEPTSLRIGYCMRGSMKLKMLTRGRSCHASRPHEGDNAAFHLIEDLIKIKNLPLKDNSPWGQATVEPTKIIGGAAENQIPDLIETLLDSRTTWEIDNDKILLLLKGAGIEFEVVRNLRKPMGCDINSPLISAIKKVSPESNLYGFGGSCDMAFSTAPSIVFGPGASERSHSADEFILKSELSIARDIYSRIITELTH